VTSILNVENYSLHFHIFCHKSSARESINLKVILAYLKMMLAALRKMADIDNMDLRSFITI
jgi:hypothetical protein